MDAHGKVAVCCQLGVCPRAISPVITTLCLDAGKSYLKVSENNHPPLPISSVLVRVKQEFITNY